MYINFSNVVTVNGVPAITTAQRITNIVVNDTVVVYVNSFSDPASTFPTGSEVYVMPWQFVTDPDIRKSVNTWLISSSGPMTGGTIVEETAPLDEQKVRLGTLVNTLRDKYIAGGATTNFGKVDTDEV